MHDTHPRGILRCWRMLLAHVVAAWVVVSPVPSVACERMDVPLPSLVESATDVIVATARQVDSRVVLTVETRFKGAAETEVVVDDLWMSCGLSEFIDGQTYFVTGYRQENGRSVVIDGQTFSLGGLRQENGRLVVTELVPTSGSDRQAEAVEVLKYVEGLAAGRPQAFVWGYLYFLSEEKADGSNVVVRARRRSDGAVATVHVPNRGIRLGYQMVVVPGEYEFSAVRDGAQVGPTVPIDASDKDVLRLNFYTSGNHGLRIEGPRAGH